MFLACVLLQRWLITSPWIIINDTINNINNKMSLTLNQVVPFTELCLEGIAIPVLGGAGILGNVAAVVVLRFFFAHYCHHHPNPRHWYLDYHQCVAAIVALRLLWLAIINDLVPAFLSTFSRQQSLLWILESISIFSISICISSHNKQLATSEKFLKLEIHSALKY